MAMWLIVNAKNGISSYELHRAIGITQKSAWFLLHRIRTAMTVGQARGVVLATVASYGMPIFEYQGLHVKSVITGSGKADKKEIQKHVMKYLNKRKLKKPLNGYLDDAADALAVAICHFIKVSNYEGTISKDPPTKLRTKV